MSWVLVRETILCELTGDHVTCRCLQIAADIPMKFSQAIIMTVAVIGVSPGHAKVEQCRFIGPKPEREACYDRQAKALDAKKAEAAAKATPAVPLERRSPEDEALSRSLRSICRGC